MKFAIRYQHDLRLNEELCRNSGNGAAGTENRQKYFEPAESCQVKSGSTEMAQIYQIIHLLPHILSSFSSHFFME